MLSRKLDSRCKADLVVAAVPGPTVADVAVTNGNAAHKSDEATWTQKDAEGLKTA